MTDESVINWITVYEANGEMEAAIVKGLLDSNDIPCIMDENASPYVIMGIPLHVTVTIKVMEKDAQIAKELIEQPVPEEFE